MSSLAAARVVGRSSTTRLLKQSSRSFSALWSNSLSFAGAESDFAGGAVRESPAEWSHSLSFASPESDFLYGSAEKHEFEWSNTLSFASPEADVCDSSHQSAPEWSETLSFASPEADYVSSEKLNSSQEWSESLSFASPDADYCFQDKLTTQHPKEEYIHHVQEPECLRDSLSAAYSLASPESDFSSLAVQQVADKATKKRLSLEEDVAVPTSLYEALRDADDTRAIVVTKPTAPFEIVAVNDAWVGLCGYTQEEARLQSLGKLLQGPETSQTAVQHLVQDLLHGKTTSTVLTNYNKTGDKFHNRVKAGPIVDEKNEIAYFVGVLQQVHEAPEQFQQQASA